MKRSARTRMPPGRRTHVHRIRVAAISLTAVALVGVTGCQRPASGSPHDDQTASLQKQLDSLRPGGVLRLNKQTYDHAGVLRITVPNVRIEGQGADLHATRDETSAVQVKADGVRVSGLTLSAPLHGKRWMAPDQHKLVLSGKGDTVEGVHIVGSAGAGIYADGARDFTIRDVTVADTRADGIHMTNSVGGTVSGVRTDRTGDDGVAVVSYDDDPVRSGNITISDVTVGSTRWGRGITVVGGHDVSIADFDVSKTNSAGVYVASEGNPYFTQSVDTVNVTRGKVTAANDNRDIVQGAVLVYSGHAGRHVRGVRMSDIAISDTPLSAARMVGVAAAGGGVLAGLDLRDFRLDPTDVPPLTVTAPGNPVTTTGWTRAGKSFQVRPR